MNVRMLVWLVLCSVALGCGAKPRLASAEKFITLEQWRQMPPHEQYDPYTLEHLQVPPRKN